MKVMLHFLLWNIGLEKTWTWHNADECGTLERYSKGKKRLVEIGCWQGVNTGRLRKSMAGDGILYAVDPYPAGRLGFSAACIMAHREVGKIRNGRVRWMRMLDTEAAQEFDRTKEPSVDFVFSDAVNTYEGLQATWNAWAPRLVRGGIYIIGTSTPIPGRIKADTGSVVFTREVVLKEPRFKHLETVGSLTVLQRV